MSTFGALTAPLSLAAFHPYGDPARPRRCSRPGRTGSRWPRRRSTGSRRCSTRSRGSRSRSPIDVTAWSNPLLMNLRRRLDRRRRRRRPRRWSRPVEARAWDGDGVPPSVGLFEIPNSTRGFEAAVPDALPVRPGLGPAVTRTSTADDIVAGPRSASTSSSSPTATRTTRVQALGSKGKRALKDWVNAGGRIVAWQGGAVGRCQGRASRRQARRRPRRTPRARSSGCRSTRRARSRRASATATGSCTRTT